MTLNWVIVHGCIYLGSYPNRIVLCVYFLRGTTLDNLWTPLLHHRMTQLLKVQLSFSVVTLELADTSQGKGSPSIVLISACQSLLGFYLMRLKTKNIVIVFKNMIFYISYSFFVVFPGGFVQIIQCSIIKSFDDTGKNICHPYRSHNTKL